MDINRLHDKKELSEWSKQDDRLMKAVEKGSVDKVNTLVVKKRVCPTKVDPIRGATALHLAVCDGKKELVAILLTASPMDIDIRDVTGRTVLHCAVRNAAYEITQALLQHQANVLLVDHEQLSVLHHACLGGHLGCIQLLLSCQAPVYMQDRNGRSALAYAAWKGQASVCRLLMENGADVNDTDQDKKTPLMLAAEKGNGAVCDYLVNKGATLLLVDKNGHDAIWFATKFGHTQVVKILEQAVLEQRAGRSRASSGARAIDNGTGISGDHVYEPIDTEGAALRPSTPPNSVRTSTPPPSLPSSVRSTQSSSRPAKPLRVRDGDDESNQYNEILEGGAISPSAKDRIEFFGQSIGTFGSCFVDGVLRVGSEEEGGELGEQGRQGEFELEGEERERFERMSGREEEDISELVEGGSVRSDFEHLYESTLRTEMITKAGDTQVELEQEQEEEEEEEEIFITSPPDERASSRISNRSLEEPRLRYRHPSGPPSSRGSGRSLEGSGLPLTPPGERSPFRGSGGVLLLHEEGSLSRQSSRGSECLNGFRGALKRGEKRGSGSPRPGEEDGGLEGKENEGGVMERKENLYLDLVDVGDEEVQEILVQGKTAPSEVEKFERPVSVDFDKIPPGERASPSEFPPSEGGSSSVREGVERGASFEGDSPRVEKSESDVTSPEVSPRPAPYRRLPSLPSEGGAYPLKSLKDLAEKRAEVDLEDSRTQMKKLSRSNAALQRQLEALLKEKAVLVEGREALEQKLFLAVNRQHWLHQELCEMRTYVHGARADIGATGAGDGTETALAEMLAHTSAKLLTVQKHIEALVRFDVDVIEDVDIYSVPGEPGEGGRGAGAEVAHPAENGGRGPAILARMERENRALQFQLKEAMRENKELQAQMDEVERMIVLARELKDENEGLIADYRRLKEVQDAENGELEEMEKVFRETVEENGTLVSDNTMLSTRLAQLEEKMKEAESGGRPGEAGAPVPPEAEAARAREENEALLTEIAALREAVGRQSQTILEMDEKLREQNKHAVGFEDLRGGAMGEAGGERPTTIGARTPSIVEHEASIPARLPPKIPTAPPSPTLVETKDATVATTPLTTTDATTTTVAVATRDVTTATAELDAERELRRQYDRVVEEYNEMAGQVAQFRVELERKNVEVEKLNERIGALGLEATRQDGKIREQAEKLEAQDARGRERRAGEEGVRRQEDEGAARAEEARRREAERERRDHEARLEALGGENATLRRRVEALVVELGAVGAQNEALREGVAARGAAEGSRRRALDVPDTRPPDIPVYARSKESQTVGPYPPPPAEFAEGPRSATSSLSDEDDVTPLNQDYRESALWNDLQHALVETEKLLNKNRRLKLKLRELRGGSTRGGGPGGGGGDALGAGGPSLRERRELDRENSDLRRVNADLETEIGALKRTIEEQSLYLRRIGCDDKGGFAASALFPPNFGENGKFPKKERNQKPENGSFIPDTKKSVVETEWKKLRSIYEPSPAVASTPDGKDKSRSSSQERASGGKISVRALSSEFNRRSESGSEGVFMEPVRLQKAPVTKSESLPVAPEKKSSPFAGHPVRVQIQSTLANTGDSDRGKSGISESGVSTARSESSPAMHASRGVTKSSSHILAVGHYDVESFPSEAYEVLSTRAEKGPVYERVKAKNGNLEGLRRENAKLNEEIEVLRRTWSEYDAIVDREREGFRVESHRIKTRLDALTADAVSKDAQIAELDIVAADRKAELERVSELQSECEEIVADYKVLLGELRRSSLLQARFEAAPEFETVTELSPFNELRGCWRTYEMKERERLELVDANASLRNDVDSLRAEAVRRSDVEKETARMSAEEQEKLRRKLWELEERFSAKSAEMATLMNSLEVVQKEKARLAEETQTLRGKLTERDAEFRTLAESAEKQREAASAERDALRRIVEESRAAARMPPNYEEELLGEIEYLRSEGRTLRDQLKEKELEAEELKDELNGKMDALRAKLDATQRRADKDCAEFLDEQELLTAENDRLRGELIQFERDFIEAEDLFEKEKENARRERKALQDEIERLREKAKEGDAEKERRRVVEEDGLFAMNERLVDDNEKLSFEVERLGSELERLAAEKRQTDSAFRELEQKFRRLEVSGDDERRKMAGDVEAEKRARTADKKAVEEELRAASEHAEEELKSGMRQLELDNQRLVDENARLAAVLEMERMKNFAQDSSDGRSAIQIELGGSPPEYHTVAESPKSSQQSPKSPQQSPKQSPPKPHDDGSDQAIFSERVRVELEQSSAPEEPPELPPRHWTPRKHFDRPDTTKKPEFHRRGISQDLESGKVSLEEEVEYAEMNALREEVERLLTSNRQLVEENFALRRELGRSRQKPYSPVITWSIGLQTSEEELLDSSRSDDGSARHLEEEIQRLRSSNRALSLQVAELQYRLSQQLSNGTSGGRAGSGRGAEGAGRALSPRSEAEQRYVRAKLREFAGENLKLLAAMAETEESCDRLREELRRTRAENRQLHEENSSLKELSTQIRYTTPQDLVQRLRDQNNKLRQFIAVLEEHIDHSFTTFTSSTPIHSPSLSPISPPPSLPPPPPTEEPRRSPPALQGGARGGDHTGTRGAGGHEGDGGEFWGAAEGDGDRSADAEKERERRYRDIVCSYRRHLLSSIQGRIDPRVREALLQIVQLRQRQQQNL